MVELKSRFGNIEYKHFRVNFKGLIIEVKLLDDKAVFPNTKKEDKFKGFVEEFKLIVQNGEKEINYKFYNSIMEREISENLKLNLAQYPHGQLKLKEFRAFMHSKMWGGYDKVRNLKELNQERIYFLLSSILNCFARDRNSETESFKDFCDNFGYDDDSRTAERIFNEVIKMKEAINSLKLSEEQNRYFDEEVNQETDKFNEDVKTAIKEA